MSQPVTAELAPCFDDQIHVIAQLITRGWLRVKMPLSIAVEATVYIKHDSVSRPDELDYSEEDIAAFYSGKWKFVSVLTVIEYGRVRAKSSGTSGVEFGRFKDEAEVGFLSDLIRAEISDAVKQVSRMANTLLDNERTLVGV